MEVRGGQEEEKEMPSSLVYNPPIKESSPPAIVPTLRETKGHHHHHHHLHLQQQQHQQRHHGIINSHSQSTKPRIEIPETHLDAHPVASAPPASSPSFASFKSSVENLTQPQAQTIRYKECLRNHAASMGGHIVDGCGEFMPGGEEDSPDFFKCVACDCHRNFHRKEIDGEWQLPDFSSHFYNAASKSNRSHRATTLSPSTQHHRQTIFQPTPINARQHQRFSFGISTCPVPGSGQPVMMAFGGGGAEESSSEDLAIFQAHDLGLQSGYATSSKKRFRTKFTPQQKDRMVEFAERLGWRMMKQDEQEVTQFCAEVGVKRQVFKVWMHNNKQPMKKQQL